MLDQVFVNDEQAFLKKERELFTQYEGKHFSQKIMIYIKP